MSTAGFADEGPDPLPPLPKRVRGAALAAGGVSRYTVTRLGLIEALRPVWPVHGLPDLADLADAILANLPPAAASLPLPAFPARQPVPDHECSFLLHSQDGTCRFGCGKTWARNVAELNLDKALAEFAATEPAPAREDRDGVLLGVLRDAVAAGVHPAARGAILSLAADLDRRATRADDGGLTRGGSITAATFRTAAKIARRHAEFGPPMPGAEMAPDGPLVAPGASEGAAPVFPDPAAGKIDLRAASDDPWIPADGAGRDHGNAL